MIKKSFHPRNGFTLIEVMIVVVIIAILAGIAYPSYKKYMISTRRTDAQTALLKVANQQERFFTECNWYANTLSGTRGCGASAGNGVLGYSTTSPDGHYVITISATAGAINQTACSAWTCGYQAIADPDAAGASGLQKGNGKLRIDSMGVKQWDKANDGSYSAKWSDK